MKKVIDIGKGILCPKCNKQCITRKRIKNPENKNFFYTQWDFCKDCNAVYFDDKYKSGDRQEDERQKSFFDSLK